MANNENLEKSKLNKLSKEAARKIQSKGGKARAAKIKETKKIKEYLEIGLALTIQDKNGNTYTRKEAGVIKLIERYVKGDQKAFDSVVELLGENPAKKLDVTTNQPSISLDVKKEDIKKIVNQINNLVDE